MHLKFTYVVNTCIKGKIYTLMSTTGIQISRYLTLHLNFRKKKTHELAYKCIPYFSKHLFYFSLIIMTKMRDDVIVAYALRKITKKIR